MAGFSFSKSSSNSIENLNLNDLNIQKSENGNVKHDPSHVKQSMSRINSIVRQMNWLKSDIIMTRPTSMFSSKINATTSSSSKPQTSLTGFSFGQPPTSNPQPTTTTSTPTISTVLTNLKRRTDVLDTPQFAEVINYVSSFENSVEVLKHLWKLAGGVDSNDEGLQFLLDYLTILKFDSDNFGSDINIKEEDIPAK